MNLKTIVHFTLFWIILSMVGCGGAKRDAYKNMPPQDILQLGDKNFEKGNYVQAIKDYEALEARYPYGDHSDKAQLALIDAYYQQGDAPLALTAADRFIRMHPLHPRVDRAYYLKGLVVFDQNTSFLYRYLPVDRALRDPKEARDAFEAFKELVTRFPSSQYAPDARKRMVHLREQLAQYELTVAEYYMKRGAYLSAANRANHIIRVFDQTTVIPEALMTMVKAYRHLGMDKLAADALKTLKANYPTYQLN
jgi:outer membrane protein assembly factor BamD